MKIGFITLKYVEIIVEDRVAGWPWGGIIGLIKGWSYVWVEGWFTWLVKNIMVHDSEMFYT